MDSTKIAVVGDIHEHEEQFDKLVDLWKPGSQRLIVFVGDIYDKGYGFGVAESITFKIKKLIDNGFAYTVKGNHELKHIYTSRRDGLALSSGLKYFASQPLALSFQFNNKTTLLVVHAGVAPYHKLNDLGYTVETSYIRYLNKNNRMINLKKQDGEYVLPAGCKLWHKVYDGRFGYIASGHLAQSDGMPKFYNYSCNLDSGVFRTGKLVAQVFGSKGRENLLEVSGPSYVK